MSPFESIVLLQRVFVTPILPSSPPARVGDEICQVVKGAEGLHHRRVECIALPGAIAWQSSMLVAHGRCSRGCPHGLRPSPFWHEWSLFQRLKPWIICALKVCDKVTGRETACTCQNEFYSFWNGRSFLACFLERASRKRVDKTPGRLGCAPVPIPRFGAQIAAGARRAANDFRVYGSLAGSLSLTAFHHGEARDCRRPEEGPCGDQAREGQAFRRVPGE